MSAEKVIQIAREERGYTESPAGSNRTKYWEVYDPAYQGQPWCVSFLWWCFREAGERMSFFGGGKTASCSILLRWYREQGLTVPVSEVQVGDIVLLNFHRGEDPEHCGLVVEVSDTRFPLSNGPINVRTIEGNTTPGEEGSQDNGGCVALKRRFPKNIVAVCRPQYQPEEPQPKDDLSGHWAEKDIRQCMELGLMKGYPDGTFKPDEFVTRAELATVLRRFGGQK